MTAYAAAAAVSVPAGTTGVTHTSLPGTLGSGKLYAFCNANVSATWSASAGWTSVGVNASTGTRVFEHPGDGTEGTSATFTRATVTTGIAGVAVVRVTNAGVVVGYGSGQASNTNLVTASSITGLASGTYYLL